MSYSPVVSFFMDKLQGFSTNHYKIMPQGSTTAAPNSIIRITLPSKSIVNLRSFALHFDAEITAANDEGRFPNKIESLIERVEVQIGGAQIDAGHNYYNVLAHAKDILMGKKSCPLLGHPTAVRASSPYTTAGTNGITSSKEEKHSYIIDKWEGFLGTADPQMMDLGLMGDVVVSIYLTSNDVLIDADGTTHALFVDDALAPAAQYQLTNIYATIETVSLADGTYEAMTSQLIGSKGYLEIPFKRYIDFQSTTATDLRWQVATQSLDRVWIIPRADNFSTQGGAVQVAGYLTAATTTQYDNVLDYFQEKFISKYFNFPEPAANFKTQVSINSALYPQFQGTVYDWAEITKNSLEHNGIDFAMNTYRNNYCIYVMRLNLPESEKMRLMSGLNTKGINLNAAINFYSSANKSIYVFAETTAVLQVGAGGQTHTEY